jgi:hypothetical protein
VQIASEDHCLLDNFRVEAFIIDKNEVGARTDGYAVESLFKGNFPGAKLNTC